MPAFKIHLADGTSYVTSMAGGITLAQATAYFKGNFINRGTYNKDRLVRCTNVEQIPLNSLDTSLFFVIPSS